MSDKVTEEQSPAPEPEPSEVAAAEEADDIAIEVDASEVEGGEIVPVEGDPIAALETRIAQLEKEKQETFDRLLRTTADLDNFRKRSRRELDDARVDARTQVLREMLPVVDNLERALEHAGGAESTAEGIVDGVRLVLRQFVQAFERMDVAPFEAVGQPFDPNLHEAVGQVETAEVAPGAIAQELQRGYKIGGRLLRPAMVVVARPPAEPSPPTGANGHDADEGAPTGDESDSENGDA